MSTVPAVTNNLSAVESALVRNDISKLSTQERISYLNTLCESVGLNPLTKPFAFLSLQGREVVYATKDCTEQLRKIHGVSTQIVRADVADGCFEVHIKAQDRTGRTDEDFASIPLGNAKGADLSNIKMKCITKAKRRVTLSICGLGILDESELDTIAQSLKKHAENPQITNPLKEVKEADNSQASLTPEAFKDSDFGEYVCKVGRKYNGMKLKEVGEHDLNKYLDWLVGKAKENGDVLTGDWKEFHDNAEAYLKTKEFGNEQFPE